MGCFPFLAKTSGKNGSLSLPLPNDIYDLRQKNSAGQLEYITDSLLIKDLTYAELQNYDVGSTNRTCSKWSLAGTELRLLDNQGS